jgi:histidinol-phosphate aminotransferase
MNTAISALVNAHLKTLEVYETGKPIEETAREMGLEPDRIIKLASNENPLGPSPKAVEAMRSQLERVHLYPDGGGYYLREAIAQRFGMARENIVLGNGSNEIIEFLGHSFLHPQAEVVVSEHAFVVYKLMANLFGAKVVEVADPGFRHDLPGMLRAVTPATRLLFVANPNNPTGTTVSAEEVEALVAELPPHVIAVFDEAYYEFMDNPPDTLRYVREGRNVVVMRTFSKAQGLAGLRIGYGFAPPHIAEWLQRSRQPFNANVLAQVAALAGLADEEHQRRTREVVDTGRAWLEKEFTRMGIEFLPSCANFILAKVGRGREVFGALLKEGIIVRAMDSYKLPEWIRVTVGTMDQNRRFAEVLERLRG